MLNQFKKISKHPSDYQPEFQLFQFHLYPNSPGYRLILNNVLFPAAKKEKEENVKYFACL